MEDIFPKYNLRRMDERDLDWVLQARNSKHVRAMSSSSKRIGKREHRIWFDCSTDSIKLVFEEDEKPKGVIIYDPEKYWSFYLTSSVPRNKGIGRLMLSLFLAYASRVGIRNIYSHVKKDNTASIVLHQSMGFRKINSIFYEDCFHKTL